MMRWAVRHKNDAQSRLDVRMHRTIRAGRKPRISHVEARYLGKSQAWWEKDDPAVWHRVMHEAVIVTVPTHSGSLEK